MKESLTIAVVQSDARLGDLGWNAESHARHALAARREGADLVLFPELSLTGYTVRDMNWDLAFRPEAPPPELRPLIEAGREVAIVAGGIEEGEGYEIFNSAFLVHGGGMHTVHRKTYPPTYGLFEELRYFSPGRRVRAFDAQGVRLGVLICEDLWHMALPYVLSRQQSLILLGLVASPLRLGADSQKSLQISDVTISHYCTYARLLSSFVCICNRVGCEDGVTFRGGSVIVGPDGSIIAQACSLDEDRIMARLDLHEVRRSRRLSRHVLDDNAEIVLRELRLTNEEDRGRARMSDDA